MNRYSEKELIKSSKEQIFALNNLVDINGTINDDIFGKLPCWIHINKMSDLSPTYFNKTALNNFQESLNDIKKDGLEFLYKIIHPETVKVVVPLVFNFINTEDETKVLFFEQRIRYSIKEEYKTHLCFSVINEEMASTLTTTFPASFLEGFIKNRVFKNNEIFEKFYERYILLTSREREILKHVAEGITNKQIGEILSLSEFTIKTHRQNIFKKLGTNKITDLTKIALYFKLISE